MTISKQALLAELQKRKKIVEKPTFDFKKFTFPAQYNFFRGSTKRFKNAVCSRRAGKTIGIAADMLDTAISEQGVNLLYITVTQQAARAIIWGDLMKLVEDYEIDCKIDNSRLTIKFPNKSTIYIAGAKDRMEIEKYRGWKLKKCYIDEAQSFRSYIKELINDVIIPALRDLKGELYLTGTPGPVLAGVFYEYTQSPNWDAHHWTAFNNPHMHNPEEGNDLEETLAEERIMRGIDVNDPSYIRETYGKWVEDRDALVFKFNKSKNIYTSLPATGEWTYIMGVDIGYNDSDAIAVLGYNSHTKLVYLVDEFVKAKQNITQLVAAVTELKDLWNPVKIVMDAGALGKKIQEEIRTRHGIHMEAADKNRKVEFIELLNDDLRTGRFQAPSSSLFEEDCMLVTWDKDSMLRNPDRPKISDTYHSDACFTEDMLVTCYNGLKKIKDVSVGDLVLTHTGSFKPVTNVMSREYSGELLELQVKGIHNNIKCTPEHRFYSALSKRCYKGSNTGQRVCGDLEWVDARSLKPSNGTKENSYLSYPKVNSGKVNMTREMCFLVGYYVAEGSLGGNGSQITFACNKKEVVVKKILQKAIDNTYPKHRVATSKMTMWRRKNNIGSPRKLGTFKTKEIKGTEAAINTVGNKELHNYLKQCGKSDYKSFPDSALDFNEEQALYCLAGYLYGDGHFSKTGVSSSSISKNINMTLKTFYSKLNMNFSECKLNKRGVRKIAGKLVNCKDQYALNITKESTKNLINLIKSKEDLKEVYESKLIHDIIITNNSQVNGLYKRLSKVNKSEFSGTVYNIEVQDDESYVINDCIVHNCDAVLYAWRECRHYLSEKPTPAHAPATNAYMDQMEKEEAAKMQQKLSDPDGFAMEEQFEQDMDDLDSIIDLYNL